MAVAEVKELSFKIIIEECEEGGYYAECPAFQGCHVEGDTYEETISEMKAAISSFVEDYRDSKEEIPSDNYSVASITVAL